VRPFKHLNATSLDAAISALAEADGRAAVIAGGTDVLGILKDGIHPGYPELVVNLKTVPGLAGIREDARGLSIGALTRLHTIERDRTIRERYGVLAEAERRVASPQIRRMGTIGGNLCQQPRCWYYRHPENTLYCTRKAGRVCNALTGENRYHSIFGAMRMGPTPCSANCPAGVDIPAYMSLLRDGDLVGAARLLLEANPLPAITGRVCPHFCEGECNRGEVDEAVSVRGVERFLGDFALDDASVIRPPRTGTGRTVAIVGAGPAGLAAASYLARWGHRVRVYDRMPEPGGMLRYAIPAYRLPNAVVQRSVQAIEGLGVEVGRDVSLEQLRQEYDAVFLAAGAWRSPLIGLAGGELARPGVSDRRAEWAQGGARQAGGRDRRRQRRD